METPTKVEPILDQTENWMEFCAQRGQVAHEFKLDLNAHGLVATGISSDVLNQLLERFYQLGYEKGFTSNARCV